MGILEFLLIDVLGDRLCDIAGIAVLDHQVCDVRLARIVFCEKILYLFFRERKAKFAPQEIESRTCLLHAQRMPLEDDFCDSHDVWIVAVSQNVILPHFVFARKLDAADKRRSLLLWKFLQNERNSDARFDRVVICNRKQVKPGITDFRDDSLQTVCSVRY